VPSTFFSAFLSASFSNTSSLFSLSMVVVVVSSQDLQSASVSDAVAERSERLEARADFLLAPALVESKLSLADDDEVDSLTVLLLSLLSVLLSFLLSSLLFSRMEKIFTKT
jgi:hypothetical protein